MIKLELINENKLTAPASDDFKSWVNQVASELQTTGEICIKVVDIKESQLLNHQYRGKDRATNVLSFPSEIPDFVESEHLGDLAVCSEIVEQEAIEQEKKPVDHWAHMTIHGVLHLLGYDHIENADAEQMEALEVDLLSALGISDPYA